MKSTKIWAARNIALVIAIGMMVLPCFMAAAGPGEGDEAGTGTASIKFYEQSSSSSSSSSSGGGTSQRDTDPVRTTTIVEEVVPLEGMVDIVDPDAPLANLPETGGNTLIPLLLIAAGGALVLSAGACGSGGSRARA